MKILIGGGTGFIGSHLYRILAKKGYEVTIISRHPADGFITWQDLQRYGLPSGLAAVVNLAGHSLMASTRKFEDLKGVVSSSRIDTTRQLAEAIKKCDKPPKVWISTSAIGYYPPSEKARYTEDSVCRPVDFLSQLCVDWENAAKLPASVPVRHVTVRIGIVLGRDGGAIKQMFMPFFFGVGGKLGSGKQWFPWIHVDDVAGIITHAIETDSISGVLNAVAPLPATNSEFTEAFARAMWRPAVFPVPAFSLKWLYGPERAKALLEGQHVSPKRMLESNYQYLYPDLGSACKEVARLMAIM